MVAEQSLDLAAKEGHWVILQVILLGLKSLTIIALMLLQDHLH